MRLISQSGRLDFPYEQVVLQQDECWIYARLVCESKARNLLGEYSTPEKAKKVMDKLHDVHGRMEGQKIVGIFVYQPVVVFQSPEDDEVEA